MRKFEEYLKKITEDLDEISTQDTNVQNVGDDIFVPEVIDVDKESDELVVDKASIMGEIHELLEKLELDGETVIELSKQIADKAGVGWTEDEEGKMEDTDEDEGEEESEIESETEEENNEDKE